MDRARFETLTQEIAAQAKVEQLLDLETRTARLLAERVSEALGARRSVEVSRDQKCPHCGGAKIVRHGRDGGGRQRFRCLKTDESRGCGRTFNGWSGTAFARMRKPELWSGYAKRLASGTSPTKIVECADMAISRHTAWRWRHRLLAPPPRGGVEADETFFPRSFKILWVWLDSDRNSGRVGLSNHQLRRKKCRKHQPSRRLRPPSKPTLPRFSSRWNSVARSG
jgi:transposase-like protein